MQEIIKKVFTGFELQDGSDLVATSDEETSDADDSQQDEESSAEENKGSLMTFCLVLVPYWLLLMIFIFTGKFNVVEFCNMFYLYIISIDVLLDK